MNYIPAAIGLAAFVIIGVFHPIVIKAEFYFTCKIWPLFLIAGLLLIGISLIIDTHIIISSSIAIAGFASLWSIIELKHQKERVEKGWFPRNPKRKYE